MKIYLATPYTSNSHKIRTERFELVTRKAGELLKLGHIVFSPITQNHLISEWCDLPMGWEFWEKYDKSFIEWCDEVWVCQLPGWKKSVGVKAEIKIAGELGKSVKFIKVGKTQ